MPGIRLTGMASGLPPNIVEQLVAAKRAPIQKLERSKEGLNAKLALVNDLDTKVQGLKTQLGELFNNRGFSDMSVEVADNTILDGVVDAEQAKKGAWMVEVVSLAQKPGALTNGFPDKDKTQVGVGYINFKTEDGEESVYINSENNTLRGVAKAINSANVAVQASIIRDGADEEYPFRLLLTGDQFGKGNNVEYPTLYFLDGDEDMFFDQSRKATNGKIKIDGFDVEVTDNLVKDLVPGVTLDLKKPDPGHPVRISVTENHEVVEGKIDEFVKTVNSVLSFIQTQNKMDENTNTSNTLGGDSMIRSLETRLQRLLQSRDYTVKDGVSGLNQLGVEYNRGGTVDFKIDKFKSALAKNPKAVAEFFRGNGRRDSGFISKVRNFVNTTTVGSFAPITNKRSGLQSRIKRIDQNIANKERYLERHETQLRRKFANLEEQMSRLKAQGSALGGLGGGVPGLG